MAYQLTHTIQQGETIQDIANSRLNDVTRWRELVKLNDLEYPFIVKEPSEKLENPSHLLVYGDQIKLPTLNTTDKMNYQTMSKESKKAIYDVTLGQDLGLTINPSVIDGKEIAYLDTDENKKLKLNKGIKNLRQALSMRLLTRYGSLNYHANYGSKLQSFIGKTVTKERNQDIQNEIIRCIKTDPRVKEAKISDWRISGTAYWYEIQVWPLGENESFNLFIDSAQNTISVK